ncbi:hypothetical protein C1634_023030 [Chryseobacterium viscerum]|uniref:Uncharacterized protein n=1 Tax=Chryseobacterium viscerum TaxID=1037377 RepID=A0A316WH55_9FLAO|nr:hypothetical protein C1634_023030 [Chryseobacterium viscerum]
MSLRKKIFLGIRNQRLQTLRKNISSFINVLSYCFQGIDYSFPCACLNGDPHRKSQKPHKMQMQFIEILILIILLV